MMMRILAFLLGLYCLSFIAAAGWAMAGIGLSFVDALVLFVMSVLSPVAFASGALWCWLALSSDAPGVGDTDA